MGLIDVMSKGLVRRLLPSIIAEGEEGDMRLDRYGGALVSSLTPSKHVLADEGSYFVASNPTPGTGVAMTISTAFSDTVAMFCIKNTDAAGGKRIYLDYLRLVLSGTAPTAVVSRHFLLKRSTVSREATTAANRAVLAPANMASGAGRSSIARVLAYTAAAAMTIPASSPEDPMLCRIGLPTGLNVSGDSYLIEFGGTAVPVKHGNTAVRATDPALICAKGPPIIIEPGEWLVIHEWCLTEATNGPTFEYELGYWER